MRATTLLTGGGVGGSGGVGGVTLNGVSVHTPATTIQISKADLEYNPYVEELSGQSRDISNQAVWTLSSCKSGYGVEHLIDNCLDTFWQSDGPQPHLVNMQFKQKTKVKDLCIYADYKQDESYTPSRIVIKASLRYYFFFFDSYIYKILWLVCFVRNYPELVYFKMGLKAGTHVNDLREIGAYDLVEPAGWIIIPLRDLSWSSSSSLPQAHPIKTWMLQLAVLANHQNGRDTHIRQIKIHSPIETTSVLLQPKFTAVEIAEWSTIR